MLIGYLHDDARFAVKRRALADLRYLASADRAHLWSEANVAAVIAFARKDSAAASGGKVHVLLKSSQEKFEFKFSLSLIVANESENLTQVTT